MGYKFVHIDKKGPDLSLTAAKYKKLRLEALRLSPGAFSSTLETESRFTDAVWLSRLLNPEFETFVCVAAAGDNDITGSATTTEFVAQVTLRGPIPADEFRLPEEAGEPPSLPDAEEEKWQMLSLYTLPGHRGKGLGKDLCGKAFAFLGEQGRTEKDGGHVHVNVHDWTRRAVVRIMVKPENTGTLALYGGLGFVKTGLCTLEEALGANGDAGLIPDYPLGPEYTTRKGVVMRLYLERGWAG